MENETVLITGGAGFIGSHIVDKLVRHGFNVVVLDDFSTGKIEYLRPHFDKPNFCLVKGKAQNKADVRKALNNVDAVFHLAAITNVAFSVDNPILTDKVNVDGTLNLLSESRKAHVRLFINISSCAVYGDPIYTPIEERHPTIPLSPYAASKLAAEHYCRIFHEIYGVETISLRYFNVYGPRQSSGPYGGVITQFIKRLQKGQSPVVFGDGRQTRDFVYIEDAVDAALDAFNCRDCAGEIINIGSGKETTINELARILIESLGVQNAEPDHVESRLGDIKKSYADLSKAKKLLGYKPNTPLRDGLRKLLTTLG